MWCFAGALLLLAWLGEPGEAGGRPALSVDAAESLRCPKTERALAALTRQLAPRSVVPTAQPLGHFHLTLREHGAQGVTMSLRSESSLLVDRTIDVAPHECEGLADTVALITAAWVREADNQVGDPPADATVPVPPSSASAPDAPADRDDVPSRAPDAQTPAARAPRTSEADAPAAPPRRPASDAAPTTRQPSASSPPRGQAKPIPEQAAPTPKASAEEAHEPPAPGEPPPESDEQDARPAPRLHVRARPRVSLEAGIGTTVSLDGLAVPTMTGRAGAELAQRRLRLGLRAHAESARVLDNAGIVSVRHAQLELTGGPTFADGGLLHGAVLLGAGVDLIAAEASRHARGSTQRSFTPIGSLALRASLRANAALDVFVAAELVLALRRERFTAEGEPLARTARSRTRLLIGVSWHVF